MKEVSMKIFFLGVRVSKKWIPHCYTL